MDLHTRKKYKSTASIWNARRGVHGRHAPSLRNKPVMQQKRRECIECIMLSVILKFNKKNCKNLLTNAVSCSIL